MNGDELAKKSLREPKINRRDDETFLQFADWPHNVIYTTLENFLRAARRRDPIPLRAVGHEQNSTE